MTISNVNNTTDLSKINNVSQAVKASAAEEKVTEKVKREDTFVKSSEEKTEDKTGIYSRESILEQLKNSEEQRVKAFEETIKGMMAQQGQTVNLTFRGVDFHVTEDQRKEAEKSISDGGEYSVNAVSDRIMNMAKALIGDDSSKIGLMKDAVIKGFGGAAKLLETDMDNMPEITKNTYKEIMNRFDEWEKSFKTDQTTDDKTAEVKAPETKTVSETE